MNMQISSVSVLSTDSTRPAPEPVLVLQFPEIPGAMSVADQAHELRIQRRPDIGLKVATAIDACIRGFLGTRADISKQVLSDVDYELLTGMKYKPQYGREHIPHFVSEFLFRASVHQS